MAKKGPKGKAYEAEDGTIYPELRQRPDGRFYVNRYPLKILELSTQDERDAIRRYLKWKGEVDNIKVRGKDSRRRYVHIIDDEKGIDEDYWEEGPFEVRHNIPEDHLIDIFTEWITTRPKWLADRTGIEELAYLDKLEKLEILSLARIAKTYSTKNISDEEMVASEIAWKEFASAVGVNNLNEVGTEEVQKYADFLVSKRFAPKTFRKRFGKVMTLLNYAKPRHKQHAKKIEEVKLDLKSIIELPKASAPNPTPLRPKQFKAILNAANENFRGIIMISLNAALHAKELSELREDELDLEHYTFVTKRTKTNIARCAHLWPETIKAIKPYMDNEEYLFYQVDGRNHDRHSIYREWKRTCKRAKVKGFSFDSLRDSCRTHMRGDAEAAAFVMGHTFSISDKYTYRDAEATKEVLEQVRQKYL